MVFVEFDLLTANFSSCTKTFALMKPEAAQPSEKHTSFDSDVNLKACSLPQSCWMTLGKLYQLSGLSSLICKKREMIIPTSQGGMSEKSRVHHLIQCLCRAGSQREPPYYSHREARHPWHSREKAKCTRTRLESIPEASQVAHAGLTPIFLASLNPTSWDNWLRAHSQKNCGSNRVSQRLGRKKMMAHPPGVSDESEMKSKNCGQ